MHIHSRSRLGFTLVELAIVLVIIGLIVGGVLVGMDLIKGAKSRATVSQIEHYNVAATTFRLKYGFLPGDISNSKATQFGLDINAGRTGGAGLGDGNGIIMGGSGSNSTAIAGEIANFWLDLATVGLIPANVTAFKGSTHTYAGDGTQLMTPALLGAGYLPQSKLHENALISVFSMGSHHYFAIAAITGWTTSGQILLYTNGVSPHEARGIDEKLDDGYPTSGTVIAVTGYGNTSTTPDAPTSACVAAGGSYLTDTDAHANAMSCNLQLRASFK